MQFLVVVSRIRILDFDSFFIEFFDRVSHNFVIEKKQILCLIRQRNSTCFAINHFFAQFLRQFYDVFELINHQCLILTRTSWKRFIQISCFRTAVANLALYSNKYSKFMNEIRLSFITFLTYSFRSFKCKSTKKN